MLNLVFQKKIVVVGDVVETFFGAYLKSDIPKAFNRIHQAGIDDCYRDANKV